MPISRLLTCDDCERQFWWKVNHRSDPGPEECPICHGTGEAPAEEDKPWTAGAPGIMTSQNTIPDRLYRMNEDMSTDRAIMAAEMAGTDVSEMSGLKITNQKDNMREGDTANVVSMTAVQREIAANARLVSTNPNTAVAGAGYAEAVKSGPFPNMGAKMAQSIGMQHGNNINAMRMAGNVDAKAKA